MCGTFARKTQIRTTVQLSKCHHTVHALYFELDASSLRWALQVRTFSAAAALLRNEGGLKASFASVSSVLGLVY